MIFLKNTLILVLVLLKYIKYLLISFTQKTMEKN